MSEQMPIPPQCCQECGVPLLPAYRHGNDCSKGPIKMLERRERIATAIFAAMQSNPNWTGSLGDADKAVEAADDLIAELDDESSLDGDKK